jgi:capsular polysaccharide biosynthesis protein
MNEAPRTKADNEISLTEIWIKLQEWWSYLLKRKIWILIVAICFALGGYLKAILEKPSYSATLTFALEQGTKGSGGLSSLASQFGMSLGADGTGLAGENLLTLMKSRSIIEEVLLSSVYVNGDSLLLIDQYVGTWPNLKESWDSLGLYPMTGRTCCVNTQDSALGEVVFTINEKMLAVSKIDEKQSFVTVSYTGHDEAFARHFVELLTQKATEFYISSKMANSHANIAKLEQRVDSVSAELQAAMVGYASSQDQNSFTVQSTAKVPSVQKQMKVTMLTTLYGELVKNLELSKTMAAREEPLITVIDRPHYPLRVRESKLKSAAIPRTLGVFLTLVFLGARAFIQDLNKQAAALKQVAEL